MKRPAPSKRPRVAGSSGANAGPLIEQSHDSEDRSPSIASLWIVGLTAALCVLFSVTFKLNDPDFWQHLLVGKAIWQQHSVPMTHLWSWPTLHQPEVLPSWGFRALLWPFWAAGETLGLFVWRWVTTLATFLIAWLTARKLGARGLWPFIVIVVCCLAYRYRSQVRPETLTNLLLAGQLYLLELHRQQRRDLRFLIIPIAWVWANAHISYYLSIAILLLYLVCDRRSAQDTRSLLAITVFAALACFVNPFGWRALAQPLEYFFVWRHEPIYRSIAELHPIDWSFHASDGLLVTMLAWPALQLWRAVRREFDPVELGLWALFTLLAVTSQRFVGSWAVVAASFLSRDLDHFMGSLSPRLFRVPRWLGIASLSLLCLALCWSEWRRPDIQPGIGLDPLASPVAACDFIEREGIRGRFFNHFELGGYLAWRFWPQRDRLPFMDIHQSGTRGDRLLYQASMSDPDAWRQASQHYRFDTAIIRRIHARGDRLLDTLDSDSLWALIFVDDVAAVYVRRDGSASALAERLRYRILPGGKQGLDEIGASIDRVPGLRASFRRELERAIPESPANSSLLSVLATLDIQEQRFEDARDHLRRARAVDPLLPVFHYRLAWCERALGHADAAIDAYRSAEHSKEVPSAARDLAPLFEGLGRRHEALREYQRALQLAPRDSALLAGLARLQGVR